MANEQNLKPFKKGSDERRNLNGRPKGREVSTILAELLDKKANANVKNLDWVQRLASELTPEEMERLTNGDVLAMRLYVEAIAKGDITAIREMLDRVEGKAKQTVNLQGNVAIGITEIEVIHTTPEDENKGK